MIITLALATATMIAPPIKVSVHAPADVRQQVVKIALREAAEIWMASGFAFAWNADAEGATEPPRLHVTFDDSPNRSRDYVKVLGWVQFDEGGVPQPQIHLSYTSAQILLRDAYGAELERYTMLERDVALGRALGRALAHELG